MGFLSNIVSATFEDLEILLSQAREEIKKYNQTKKAKAEKAIAYIELISNFAQKYPKALKRNNRLKRSLKKRAFIKSKFYGRLRAEMFANYAMPMTTAFQAQLIISQPIPKFENSAIIGES